MIDWFWRNYVRLIIGMVIWIIVGSVLLVILGGCSKIETWSGGPREEKWVWEQHKRCYAAKSRGAYNKETNKYECWNKPAFRRPKLVFKETYKNGT